MNLRTRPAGRTAGRSRSSRALHFLLLAGILSCPLATVRAAEVAHDDPKWLLQHGLPLEHPDNPPGVIANVPAPARAASNVTFGRFTSIQVNVNGSGADILGDAANEPSLAVSPTDHHHMVIGWRQFDTITSNFRQAGFGYTSDGGLTWTTGKIEPGVFRSDPVLATDGAGRFFYNSLTTSPALTSQIFSSANGSSWGPEVFGFGGDKQWMTVDRDLGNFYQAWSTASNNYDPNTFNKSIDDGDSFGSPSFIPNSPVWGTLAVDTDHTVYLVGWGTQTDDICVSRSTNAQLHDATPVTFTTTAVDLGGFLQTGGPNPAGLLGQLWIAIDRSAGPHAGWIYVLASVVTPTDPLDVHFIRSTDHGVTWSAPVRVNDDPTGTRAFQWFGTMSVAPSGRIDAVWNDTRGSSDSTKSALYYSYSTDGGTTWSVNERATPTWSSTVGFPNQTKIGDYYTMTSDDDGADLAYAATFNGGEDIYYLRIPRLGSLAVDPPVAPARRLDNVPNPFTGATTIRFDLPAAGAKTRLEVFDLAGHRVATLVDAFLTGPTQAVRWDGRCRDGSAAAPGVYWCRLETPGATRTRKLLRVR